MSRTLVVVDAFTDRPFRGNPAAVCKLETPRDAGWMQDVAREMNLSETAFLHEQPDGVWGLRWFTPGGEVDLCGHATLASAHVLWETGGTADLLRFQTRSGELRATRAEGLIWLDFPALPVEEVPTPVGLAETLGATPVAVGQSRWDLLVELESEAVVRELTPSIYALPEARGVIVTAAATTPGLDFVSRFFAPAYGIPEDPVTGSAHCVLAPYWQTRLGKAEMTAYQASVRGGTVRVRCDGDRVHLGGQAVTVLRSELVVE